MLVRLDGSHSLLIRMRSELSVFILARTDSIYKEMGPESVEKEDDGREAFPDALVGFVLV